MREKRCQKVGVLKNSDATVFCTISRVQTPSDDETVDLLAPVPAQRTGDLVGYARASTKGQLLGRSIQDLIAIVSGLRKRGVGFTSLHEALDTTTPGGRLVFHVFAALAEFIRELIVQGTHEGLDAARARGARLGRPSAMTEEQIRHA